MKWDLPKGCTLKRPLSETISHDKSLFYKNRGQSRTVTSGFGLYSLALFWLNPDNCIEGEETGVIY